MKDLIREHPGQVNNIWEMMNSIEGQSFVDEGRVYGGGLRKVEPNELMNIPVPEIEAFVCSTMKTSPGATGEARNPTTQRSLPSR